MIRRRLCELNEQIPELPRYVTLGDDVPPLPTRLEVHEYSYLYLYSYLVLECKFPCQVRYVCLLPSIPFVPTIRQLQVSTCISLTLIRRV